MAVKSIKATLWCRVLAIAMGFTATLAWALGDEPRSGPTVTQYLTPEILQSIFPGADKIGEVEGTPTAVSVSKGGHQVGQPVLDRELTQVKGLSNPSVVPPRGID